MPTLRPATGHYKVGDVLILSYPGMKPREFRVTSVQDAGANSCSYTMTPVDSAPYYERYAAVEIMDCEPQL